MVKPKRNKRNFIKEAGLEACSLVNDGYVIMHNWHDNHKKTLHIFMRHRVNANKIHIAANQIGYTIYKNDDIVKRESIYL